MSRGATAANAPNPHPSRQDLADTWRNLGHHVPLPTWASLSYDLNPRRMLALADSWSNIAAALLLGEISPDHKRR